MLVLERHTDEDIIIGDDIVVKVVRIGGDKVRLGVTAPAGVTVHRREVYEAICREREPGQPLPTKRRSPRRHAI